MSTLRTNHRAHYGPLTRYAKLRVAHAPGMLGSFSPLPRVSDPNMHQGTCFTHVPWCMPGSLTNGFLWSRWRGKRSRHSRKAFGNQLRLLFYGFRKFCKFATVDWQRQKKLSTVVTFTRLYHCLSLIKRNLHTHIYTGWFCDFTFGESPYTYPIMFQWLLTHISNHSAPFHVYIYISNTRPRYARRRCNVTL